MENRNTGPGNQAPSTWRDGTPPSQAKRGSLGERKHVTVMFADIGGFTSLAETMDPEQVRDLLNACFEQLVPAITTYGGTVDKFIGDQIMALFGAPVTHENDPERALRAALEMREALAAFNAARGTQLSIHFGINTGLVIAGGIGVRGRQDYSVIGDAVNLASRLEEICQQDEILVGPDTYRRTSHLFAFKEATRLRLKGKAEPVTICKLLGRRTRANLLGRLEVQGLSSPLVGRAAEISAFSECVQQLQRGQGGLVSIVAEAGIGKSRLVAEVRRKFADAGISWLEGRALSFSQTISYWPFLEIIQSDAGITIDDPEEVRWTKLERRIDALFADETVEVLPYLATLLTLDVPEDLATRVKYLDGEAMGRQIFRTMRRFFARLAQERPLVLVFEDLHWLDRSSAALLEHLLPLVHDFPILICGVGRFEDQSPTQSWVDVAARDHANRHTEIELTPLSATESVELVGNLLKIDELPHSLCQIILQKAEGNPFFVEEVIRTLIDVGALVRDKTTGHWQVTTQMEQVAIPDTLQGVIMARIDRLDENAKDVVKLAAVIGRSFFYRVLRGLAEAKQELDHHLSELQTLELVREKSRVPELEYIFKHALVQEAAYESILLQQRRELHRRVGECVETIFAGRLEEFYGLLAYHYVQAEEWEKAQNYLFKAGDQAGRIAADAEALAHYQRAVAAYTRVFGDRWDPVQRAVLERKMGEALFRRGEHQQAQEYLRRALLYLGSPFPKSRRSVRLAIGREMLLQVAHRLLPGLFSKTVPQQTDRAVEERCRQYEMMKWMDYFKAPEPFILEALLLLNVAEENALYPHVAQGCSGMGSVLDAIPIPWLARYYHSRAMALGDHTQHPWALGHGNLFLGLHHRCVSGKWRDALMCLRRSAASFWEAGYLRGWAAARTMLAELTGQQGDLAASLEMSQEIIRIGQDAADHQASGWGLTLLGMMQDRAGALDEAATNLRHAIDLLRGVPDHQGSVYAIGHMAQCYLHQRKTMQAVAVLEDGRRLVAGHGLRSFLCVPLWTSRAQVYLMAAEQAAKAERAPALKEAKRACQIAINWGKLDCANMAAAYRLQGTYEWLTDKPTAAQRWWRRSVKLAETLGARYELGLTHLEMGKRTGDRVDLERAEAILSEIGAKLDLAETRELLQRCANLDPKASTA